MKVRHAAALALVGWFLMLPTFIVVPHGTTANPKKPLTFDSYEHCKDYKQGLIAALRQAKFPLTGFVEPKCTQFEDRLAN